jgi:hypothetical protein
LTVSQDSASAYGEFPYAAIGQPPVGEHQHGEIH